MASMVSIGKYYHEDDLKDLKDLPWIEVIELAKHSSHLLKFDDNDPVALKGFAISLQSKDFENTKYFLKYFYILPNDIISIISLYFKPSSVLF